MLGLMLIYGGMISLGARYQGEFGAETTRTALLTALAERTLGGYGSAFLAVLVALACFTTVVSIIVGTSDFFKGIFGGSKKSYVVSALLCSLAGVAMGQFDVSFIIDVAVPLLIFMYPICIVLILLNVIPVRFASSKVFRGTGDLPVQHTRFFRAGISRAFPGTGSCRLAPGQFRYGMGASVTHHLSLDEPKTFLQTETGDLEYLIGIRT